MPKRGGRGGGRGRQKGALKRELVFKTDGETEYAQVTKMLGNSRVETLCIADGRSRQCKIRGSLRVWIQAGDIVLISLRDFQDTKADVIWKYTADEARKLKRSGALPDGTKLNENDAGRTFRLMFIIIHFVSECYLLTRFAAAGADIDFVENEGLEGSDDEGGLAQNAYDMPPSESESEEEDDLKDI
jgi:translation initiation factor 1A